MSSWGLEVELHCRALTFVVHRLTLDIPNSAGVYSERTFSLNPPVRVGPTRAEERNGLIQIAEWIARKLHELGHPYPTRLTDMIRIARTVKPTRAISREQIGDMQEDFELYGLHFILTDPLSLRCPTPFDYPPDLMNINSLMNQTVLFSADHMKGYSILELIMKPVGRYPAMNEFAYRDPHRYLRYFFDFAQHLMTTDIIQTKVSLNNVNLAQLPSLRKSVWPKKIRLHGFLSITKAALPPSFIPNMYVQTNTIIDFTHFSSRRGPAFFDARDPLMQFLDWINPASLTELVGPIPRPSYIRDIEKAIVVLSRKVVQQAVSQIPVSELSAEERAGKNAWLEGAIGFIIWATLVMCAGGRMKDAQGRFLSAKNLYSVMPKTSLNPILHAVFLANPRYLILVREQIYSAYLHIMEHSELWMHELQVVLGHTCEDVCSTLLAFLNDGHRISIRLDLSAERDPMVQELRNPVVQELCTRPSISQHCNDLIPKLIYALFRSVSRTMENPDMTGPFIGVYGKADLDSAISVMLALLDVSGIKGSAQPGYGRPKVELRNFPPLFRALSAENIVGHFLDVLTRLAEPIVPIPKISGTLSEEISVHTPDTVASLPQARETDVATDKSPPDSHFIWFPGYSTHGITGLSFSIAVT